MLRQFNSVLIAVGFTASSVCEGTYSSDMKIEFYPANYTLKGDEVIFVVSGNSSTRKLIHHYDVRDFCEHEYGDIIRRVKEHLAGQNVVEDESLGDLGRNSLRAGSQEMPLALLQNYEYNINRPESDFTVVQIRKKATRQDKIEMEGPVLDIASKTPQGIELDAVPSTVQGHILFCSLEKDFSKTLAYFIAPYRHVDSKTPIVVLCDGIPDEDTRHLLENFKNILLVRGTPLLRKDLRRVRVQEASRTVCFAKNVSDISDPSVDAPMMLALLNIQAMCVGKANVILVEFMHSSNVRLIGKAAVSHNYLNSLISTSNFPAENLIPAFAGGHVFNNSMFHSILCQSYFESNLLSIIKMLLFFDSSSGSSDTNFFQISLPADGRYSGLSFEMMTTYLLLEHQCVCLGVYRNCFDSTSFQYVYLNPMPESLIENGDKLFLFGKNRPML